MAYTRQNVPHLESRLPPFVDLIQQAADKGVPMSFSYRDDHDTHTIRISAALAKSYMIYFTQLPEEDKQPFLAKMPEEQLKIAAHLFNIKE